MSQVNCTGNEDDFMDCIASSSETCSNGQFAGVDCLGNNDIYWLSCCDCQYYNYKH